MCLPFVQGNKTTLLYQNIVIERTKNTTLNSRKAERKVITKKFLSQKMVYLSVGELKICAKHFVGVLVSFSPDEIVKTSAHKSLDVYLHEV